MWRRLVIWSRSLREIDKSGMQEKKVCLHWRAGAEFSQKQGHTTDRRADGRADGQTDKRRDRRKAAR